jgi:hypothetical protein
MKKSAWITYNKNLNRLARRKRAALGSRQVKQGRIYVSLPTTARVTYCAACKGPVVNDEIGRRRHALKSAACKAAMKGEAK